MPQHRETSSSVSVRDLLRDGIAGRSTRHRAEPRTGDRMRLAATAAVATGTLLGTGAQLAHAAALPPAGPATDSADTITLKVATGPTSTAEQAAPARVPLEAAAVPEVAPVTAPAPVTASAPAPFGLQNLPPEVAGPLSHAEQVIKGLQQIAAGNTIDPAPYVAGTGVLEAQSWGPGQ